MEIIAFLPHCLYIVAVSLRLEEARFVQLFVLYFHSVNILPWDTRHTDLLGSSKSTKKNSKCSYSEVSFSAWLYIYIIVCCHGNVEKIKGLDCDIFIL